MRTSSTGRRDFLPIAERWGGGPPERWWRGNWRRPRQLPLHHAPHGPPPHGVAAGRNGFTLVELLVVLVIIGLVASVVVLAVPDPQGSLADEAERFAARAKAAQERAITDNRSLALRLSADGYGFEKRQAGEWAPLEQRPFRTARWKRGTEVSPAAERILFDPTGFVEPLRLTLSRGGETVTVEFADGGTIRVAR